jgi:hypothetical protein
LLRVGQIQAPPFQKPLMNYVTEYLPGDIDRTQTFTCSFLHLEVLDFSDISQSEHQKADALSNSKRKMCVETDGETHPHPSDTSSALKLLVTDKQGTHALAFELERHLDSRTLIGRQIALSGKIEVFNGIIFLNPKNCRYLDKDENNNVVNQPAYDFEIPSDYIFSEL